ncbi:MAG: BMP family ABC transporter substrate-binding protein [Devosia sp.]
MTIITRRTALKIGGAAAALPLFGSHAFAQDKLKVAYIMVGQPDDHGWNYGHDVGRLAMLEAIGEDKVETTVVTNVPEGPDCERVLRELAQQGQDLIFATSFGYGDYVHKVAKQFPDVKFEWATGNSTAPNVAIYNAKFHEGRAVIGTIAGLMTKTNKLAYIGSVPIPEVRMGANAFGIAARKVNPNATVKVYYIGAWNDPPNEAIAAKALIDSGVDVITQHTDGPTALQIGAERGIVGGFGQGADMSEFAPDTQLSSIIDNWGPYYTERVQAALDGSWAENAVWKGIKDGEVVIGPYNKKVPPDVVAAAEKVKAGIVDGSLHPFAGPIKDNTGTERVAAGDIIDDGEFWGVDWYAEGVSE